MITWKGLQKILYKIEYLRQAELDIQSMSDYITYTLYNSQAAERLKSKILKSISILQYSPLLARPRISKNFHIPIRMLPVKNYLVFYSVSHYTVTIYRIIHSRQNLR